SRAGRLRLWDVNGGRLLLDHRIRPDGDRSTAGNGAARGVASISLIDPSAFRPYAPRTSSVQSSIVTSEALPQLRLFGWGKTEMRFGAPPSASLRTIAMAPLDWDRCSALKLQHYDRIKRTGWPDRTEADFYDPTAFCGLAPERKTCSGDSGSPVLANGHIIGVVSRGSGICLGDGIPTTFVRVADYRDWVAQRICPTERGASDPNARSGFCPG
ncbi:MAG: trypsin-like serine protease, partial [Litorimonas sp.]